MMSENLRKFRFHEKDFVFPDLHITEIRKLTPSRLHQLFRRHPQNAKIEPINLKGCLTTAYVRYLEQLRNSGAVEVQSERGFKAMREEFKNSHDWYQLKSNPTDIKNRGHLEEPQREPQREPRREPQQEPPRHAPSGPRAFNDRASTWVSDAYSSGTKSQADAFLNRLERSTDPRPYRPNKDKWPDKSGRLTPPSANGSGRAPYSARSGSGMWQAPSGGMRPLKDVTIKWFYEVFIELNPKLKSPHTLIPWDDIVSCYKDYVYKYHSHAENAQEINRHISHSISNPGISRFPADTQREHIKKLLTEDEADRKKYLAKMAALHKPSATSQASKRALEPDPANEGEAKKPRIKQEPTSPNTKLPPLATSDPASSVRTTKNGEEQEAQPSSEPNSAATHAGFGQYASGGGMAALAGFAGRSSSAPQEKSAPEAAQTINDAGNTKALLDDEGANDGSRKQESDLNQTSKADGLKLSGNGDSKQPEVVANDKTPTTKIHARAEGQAATAGRDVPMTDWQDSNDNGGSASKQPLALNDVSSQERGAGPVSYGPTPDLAPLLQSINSARAASTAVVPSMQTTSSPLSTGFARQHSQSAAPDPRSATINSHAFGLGAMLRNMGREIETAKRNLSSAPSGENAASLMALNKMEVFFQAAVDELEALKAALSA